MMFENIILLPLFILGLCVGSFINVLADRLPKGEDVIKGRSHCDFCKHKLRWYELIPLLSFLLQQGKSRYCRKRLSFQYPLVELITGIGFVVLFFFFPTDVHLQLSSTFYPLPLLSMLYFLCSIVFFSSLLVIFISDFKYEIIPMEMIIAGGLAALGIHGINVINNITIIPFFLSAIGAGLFFWGLWFFTKGKAMGDGDIYLASLLGFLLGYPRIIISLYAAFLTGAIVGVILILGRKKGLKSHIPFGPFLIIGCVIALLWGDAIVTYWRSLW
jgi:leader peptidase (prepilin peptidase)/N-methyltransferase